MALVVDTGPLVAALDESDADHAACRELLARTNERIVLPAPILPEVDHLLRSESAPHAFGIVIDDVRRGAYLVEDLRGDDYDRVAELLATYRDLRLGFVDSAVLAVVERLGERKLVTLDRRHFGAVRLRHVDALELLP